MGSWDGYSRQTIDLASKATYVGFAAARTGTKLGFSVTRGIANVAAALSGAVVDHAIFGGAPVARPVFGGVVSNTISLFERLTLAPLDLGEYITSSSLLAAHSSINLLSLVFPGSTPSSFSLASFVALVRKEWKDPANGEYLPAAYRSFSITSIIRAVVAWVALQGVTQEFEERRWFKYLSEIHVAGPDDSSTPIHTPASTLSGRRGSRIRVTSDIIFPGHSGQLVSADIGEEPSPRERAQSIFVHRRPSISSRHSTSTIRRSKLPVNPAVVRMPRTTGSSPPQVDMTNDELKATLRRLSKMVLAGYGGASLLFFGVPTTSKSPPQSPPMPTSSISTTEESREEAQLADAIDASEVADAGLNTDNDSTPPNQVPSKSTSLNFEPDTTPLPPADSKSAHAWWDLLLGKHDHEIFEASANSNSFTDKKGKQKAKQQQEAQRKEASNREQMRATAVIGSEHQMPRFWVLTDHGRGQIVLVLRGTMSLNEIAVDLTCEPEPFEPAVTAAIPEDLRTANGEEMRVPGGIPWMSTKPSAGPSSRTQAESTLLNTEAFPSTGPESGYVVHGGILRMARAMGDVGNPVHLAVHEALHRNPGYELILCGHSLGAGVAAILGMMWADPKTCLTVHSSGFPVGRAVSVYCFAPPCIADAALSRLATDLVVSFVYSHDIVSRLSLGSVRDLTNAAMWLCDGNETRVRGEDVNTKTSGDGYEAVAERAKQWKKGMGSRDDPQWFVAVRKTLEANMQMNNLFPPGRVLWAMRDGDLHPSHRVAGEAVDKLRLFEVLDVQQVFSQIVFARDMLTAHMPHQYDRVLQDLL